jgi:hypothetical protein
VFGWTGVFLAHVVKFRKIARLRGVDNPPTAAFVLGTTVKRLFTVIMVAVNVLILAVLSVVGFLATKYVAR